MRAIRDRHSRPLLPISLAVFLCGLMFVGFGAVVRGAAVSIAIKHEPDVVWASWHHPGCKEQPIEVEFYDDVKTVTGCVTKSQHASLASLESDSRYALQKQGDDRFHVITNIIRDLHPVLLQNDALLFLNDKSYHNTSLVLLKDVQQHTVTNKISSGLLTYHEVYTVDTATVKNITDEMGHPVYNHRVNVSQNGRWAAVERPGVGVVLVDLATLKGKLVATDMRDYNISEETASMELAVADDGSRVAVTGNGAKVHRVYNTTDDCGSDTINAGPVIEAGKRCDYIDFTDQFNDQLQGRRPYYATFNDDTTKLSIHAWDNTTEKSYLYAVSLPAQPFRLDYLALGDSYSSGEGDVGKNKEGNNYYVSGTEYTGGCHISTRSYPFLLRDDFLIQGANMKSIACSGAQTVPDVYGNMTNYMGQGRRLYGISKDGLASTQQNALNNFTPGTVPQIEFIRKYKPKVITITTGGNDVGFGDIINYCAGLDAREFLMLDPTCGYAIKGDILNTILNESIVSQRKLVEKMLEKIKEVSPTTKIYVIGYPKFLAKSVFWCTVNQGLLNQREMDMVNDSVESLNASLKSAAEQENAVFIGVEDSLAGGRLCEGSKYVTGVLTVWADMNRSQEMFHPNAAGHRMIANAIENNSNFSLSAQNENQTASTSEEQKGSGITTRAAMIPKAILRQGSQAELYQEPGTFAPRTTVYLTGYSKEKLIAEYVTNGDGSLTSIVAIDNDFELGRHVFVLNGVDSDGYPTRRYQFITVASSDINDDDGDGIPNGQDGCFFIAQWYDEDTGEDVCSLKREPTTTTNNQTKTHEKSPDSFMGELNNKKVITDQRNYKDVDPSKPSGQPDLPEKHPSDTQTSTRGRTAFFMGLALCGVVILVTIFRKRKL